VTAASSASPGSSWLYQMMFEGGLDDVTPGSSCIVNAYFNNHERIQTEKNFFRRTYLHILDTVALLHAIILRAPVIFMPISSWCSGADTNAFLFTEAVTT